MSKKNYKYQVWISLISSYLEKVWSKRCMRGNTWHLGEKSESDQDPGKRWKWSNLDLTWSHHCIDHSSGVSHQYPELTLKIHQNPNSTRSDWKGRKPIIICQSELQKRADQSVLKVFFILTKFRGSSCHFRFDQCIVSRFSFSPHFAGRAQWKCTM